MNIPEFHDISYLIQSSQNSWWVAIQDTTEYPFAIEDICKTNLCATGVTYP